MTRSKAGSAGEEIMSTLKRVRLTLKEALEMLPDGDEIHTLKQAGNVMIGCHWDRKEIIILIKEYGAELSGETAIAMGHSIAVTDGFGPLFIETKEPKSSTGGVDPRPYHDTE